MPVENNRLIYICSPYKGNIFKKIRNIRYAKKLTKEAIKMGYVPITTHLYLTRVFKDNKPKERKQGMEVGKALLSYCGQILLGTRYGLSEGMIKELDFGEVLNIPVIASNTNRITHRSEQYKRDQEAEEMMRDIQWRKRKNELRKMHIKQIKTHSRILARHIKAVFTRKIGELEES